MMYEWFKYTDYEEYDYFDGPMAMSFKVAGKLYYASCTSDDGFNRRYFSVEMTPEEIALHTQRFLDKEYELAHGMMYQEGRYCTFDFENECVKMEDLRMPAKGDFL